MQGTVFITGASSGFGEGCARRFAKEGWQLVLVARRSERLESLQKELGGKEKIYIVSLDVQHETTIKKAVGQLPEKFRKIDVLVNNVLFCSSSILTVMVKQNSGHIINIGSIAGDWPYPGGNVYGATKAFVAQFSRNLRADLLGTKIRVTNIEPGLAETEFSLVRFKGDSKRAKGVYKGIQPLTAEDIAEIVFWVTNLPKHVNINRVEVMPTSQAWGPLALDRREE
ncbi:MAG: SDR family NAD(P)-dependent oxidoreductase [Calditrichota bacterium]